MFQNFSSRIAISALLIAFSLTSCVTTISPSTAKSLGNAALCMQYGHWLRMGNPQAVSTVAAEIKNRGGVSPSQAEHSIIMSESVAIGMSECGMLAAMGSPNGQNSTITSNGRRTQYVFRPFHGRYSTYVYTDNGKVTAVQN
ncbi:hypothetical protein PQU96_02700 [Vogesella sp. LYT5W]|uniref:Lipoprotein n=1 Tax=Vogesella margarita TaxID=2984199 RepID=A0ABT5IL70_9NEIS|nr:hypothetical protein [Vogesella margarita]MDC7713045.1 hypothetical protein [Vogesella margarita]